MLRASSLSWLGSLGVPPEGQSVDAPARPRHDVTPSPRSRAGGERARTAVYVTAPAAIHASHR